MGAHLSPSPLQKAEVSEEHLVNKDEGKVEATKASEDQESSLGMSQSQNHGGLSDLRGAHKFKVAASSVLFSQQSLDLGPGYCLRIPNLFLCILICRN